MFYVKCKILENFGYRSLNTSNIVIVTCIGTEKELIVESNKIINDSLLEIDSFIEMSNKIKIQIGNYDIYVKKDQIVRKYNCNVKLKVSKKENN
jgi:hypothetical protein